MMAKKILWVHELNGVNWTCFVDMDNDISTTKEMVRLAPPDWKAREIAMKKLFG